MSHVRRGFEPRGISAVSTMGNSNGPVPGLEWLHGLIDPVASGRNLSFRLAFAADKLRGTEVPTVFHWELG